MPNHSTTFFSSSSQVLHWSAEIQTKVYDPRKEGSTDRPSEWIRARSHNSYFAFLQNTLKNELCSAHCFEAITSKQESTSTVALPQNFLKELLNQIVAQIDLKKATSDEIVIALLMANKQIEFSCDNRHQVNEIKILKCTLKKRGSKHLQQSLIVYIMLTLRYKKNMSNMTFL